jgi:hypothetical protein
VHPTFRLQDGSVSDKSDLQLVANAFTVVVWSLVRAASLEMPASESQKNRERRRHGRGIQASMSRSAVNAWHAAKLGFQTTVKRKR